MTSSELCPFCHNTSVVSGHYYDPESVEYATPLFEPGEICVPGLRRLVCNLRTPVNPKATACLHCGKIWAELDLDKLKAIFRKYGTEESKTRLSFDLARRTTPKPAWSG